MAGTVEAQSLLTAWVENGHVPGLQYVAVSQSGLVFSHACGWADIGRRSPMTPETTLMAYSMSKTITAIAVLQLAESGRLSLDDRAAQHLDGLPYDPGITIRQLLSHTSGLPNPVPLRWVHPAASHGGFAESEALDAVIRQHSRGRATPGARYLYSNIGYWLLGRIAARAGGEAFERQVAARIIEPLGLDPQALGFSVVDWERHATGYLEKYSLLNLVKGLLIDRQFVGGYEGTWLEILPHYLNGPAFGGLVGSARAFARILEDLLQPRSRLLNDSSRRILAEPQTTRDGRMVPMTPGWHIGHWQRRRYFFKEGGGGGFHCLMRLYPDTGLGTVLMTNSTGFNVKRALDSLDRTPGIARPRG